MSLYEDAGSQEGRLRGRKLHDAVLKEPEAVLNAVFHSSPWQIHTRLYALHRSSLVNILAEQSCSKAEGTRGMG